MNEEDVCFANCVTTHTLHKRYFFNLTSTKANVITMPNIINLIKGSKRANIVLPSGTRFHINDVLYFIKSRRNFIFYQIKKKFTQF